MCEGAMATPATTKSITVSSADLTVIGENMAIARKGDVFVIVCKADVSLGDSSSGKSELVAKAYPGIMFEGAKINATIYVPKKAQAKKGGGGFTL
jgi:hypothetical protein